MHYLLARVKAFLKVVPALFCLALSIESFAADIQLAWDPNPETNLAGYKVYYGLAPGNYSVAINLGNQTTYTVTGLAVGTYYFVVTAYNTSGLESDASNEVSATIGVSATLSLVATPGSGNVTVSWSGVTSPTVTDWIGRYSTGAGDGSYGEWKYSSSCAQSPGSSPRSSGSCVFALPTVAGTYEYRLFANGTYVRLGTSNIITVSGSGGGSGGGSGPRTYGNPDSVTPGGRRGSRLERRRQPKCHRLDRPLHPGRSQHRVQRLEIHQHLRAEFRWHPAPVGFVLFHDAANHRTPPSSGCLPVAPTIAWPPRAPSPSREAALRPSRPAPVPSGPAGQSRWSGMG